ncbi:MAG: 50S ribosomal protein L7/L12 [Planctomycetota bacterium]
MTEATISEKVKQAFDIVKTFTLLEAKEFVEIFETEFGVTAAIAAPVAVGVAPADGAQQAEEKTVFDVVLENAGDKKIQVIKAVREVTTLGLKEAKDFVDSVAAGPKKVKENLPKDEAEKIKKKLEEAGAAVALK